MSEKIKVGILGATGMVGQRFVTLLENHPWFELVTLAASAHSAGKTYEEAIGSRWKMETPMPEFVKHMVVKNVADVEDVVKDVDFVFSAVNMPKDEIRAIEEEYAKTETPVVSNNSAHRWTPDVPMVGNVDAAILAETDDVRQELIHQICGSVRWVDVVRTLSSEGVTHFIEIGPGKVLAGLLARCAPDATIETAEKLLT